MRRFLNGGRKLGDKNVCGSGIAILHMKYLFIRDSIKVPSSLYLSLISSIRLIKIYDISKNRIHTFKINSLRVYTNNYLLF